MGSGIPTKVLIAYLPLSIIPRGNNGFLLALAAERPKRESATPGGERGEGIGRKQRLKDSYSISRSAPQGGGSGRHRQVAEDGLVGLNSGFVVGRDERREVEDHQTLGLLDLHPPFVCPASWCRGGTALRGIDEICRGREIRA